MYLLQVILCKTSRVKTENSINSYIYCYTVLIHRLKVMANEEERKFCGVQLENPEQFVIFSLADWLIFNILLPCTWSTCLLPIDLKAQWVVPGCWSGTVCSGVRVQIHIYKIKLKKKKRSRWDIVRKGGFEFDILSLTTERWHSSRDDFQLFGFCPGIYWSILVTKSSRRIPCRFS